MSGGKNVHCRIFTGLLEGVAKEAGSWEEGPVKGRASPRAKDSKARERKLQGTPRPDSLTKPKKTEKVENRKKGLSFKTKHLKRSPEGQKLQR